MLGSLLLVALMQQATPVTYRIAGNSEQRNLIDTREGVGGSSNSTAIVQVVAHDSIGGTVLSITVDSFAIEHQPAELATALPHELTMLDTPFEYRLFIPAAAEGAIHIGAHPPGALAHVTAALTRAFTRWPGPETQSDSLELNGVRQGFGHSRWTTRRQYSHPANTDAPLSITSQRVISGTGPAGGTMTGEATEQVEVMRGRDGALTSTVVTGNTRGTEIVQSSGTTVHTSGSWKYTLERVGAARPST